MMTEEREVAERMAQVIRCARKMSNLTQTDVSGKLEISQGTVSKIESGELILSSYHWMKFCDLTGISMDSIRTGTIEFVGDAFPVSTRKVGKFNIPARYANNAGMKVRDFQPLLNIVRKSIGKDWKSFVKFRFKIDSDYFVNLDHKLSFYFVHDFLLEMERENIELDDSFIDECFSQGLLVDKMMSLKANPFDQIKKSEDYLSYLSGDFNLIPEEEIGGKVSFKYVGKDHLSGLNLNTDLAKLYFKYKQAHFKKLFSPLNIELLESNGLEGRYLATSGNH